MMTSSCPGTPEAKSMLREIAERVGGRFAMLVAPDGTLEACAGLDDRCVAETYASFLADAVRTRRLQSDASATRAFVDFQSVDERARVYVRVIETGRLLATGFDVDEEILAPARIAARPPTGSPNVDAEPILHERQAGYPPSRNVNLLRRLTI